MNATIMSPQLLSTSQSQGRDFAKEAQIRENQRHSWDTFSPGWAQWDDFTMRFLAPQGRAIVEALSPAPGAQLLDIATGTGEPASSLAQATPGGRVIGLDLSEGMLRVAEAKAIVRQQGILEITVTERDPAVLWRDRDGIHVLDATGIEIGELENRDLRPDLQVVAGYGAPEQVEEALRLLAIAAPFADRMRGLERIANRRWDVVLTPDVRIMLPEEQPELALERAIALHEAQDVLSRDIAALDLRLAARPTIRMNANALERWRQIKDVYVGTGNR